MVAGGESGSRAAAPRKRADARRNEATLLDAAAAAFVESGVNVPIQRASAWYGVSQSASRTGPASAQASTWCR